MQDTKYDPERETVILYCPPDTDPQVLLDSKGMAKVFKDHRAAARYAANNIEAYYREHLAYCNNNPE